MQAREEIDVLVIGADQAALVSGRLLQDRGVSVAIVDPHERLGDSWRQRYDSLTLFSSRADSSLPGLALAGDPSGYPGQDEIADYLEHYARIMHLPVRME